jgi:phosphatidylglycerol:prolipoprotein diacylglycerol transferase
VRWYGVMAALGFICAIFLLEFNRRFAKVSKDQCSTLLFLAMVTGILGARIFYVVQFFHQYKNNLENL